MIFLTIIFLALMEVSLSFDNAVINASVLNTMPRVWQNRFLTWGMPVAVIGMRLIFPVAIVALASHINIADVVTMAFNSPDEYGEHLSSSQKIIDAFGGMFLLMVFLSFHCDKEKEVHWFPGEHHMRKLDGFVFALSIFGAAFLGYYTHWIDILLAAGLGVFLNAALGYATDKIEGLNLPAGIFSFIYLEILDASCSLDGVIAAFVLTNNIVIIMFGLGIGAFAIRSLTLYLVRGGALKEFIYLEHGAHYGIGALAVIMLADIFVHVPEPVTGMMGLGFIGLALLSSIKYQRIQ